MANMKRFPLGIVTMIVTISTAWVMLNKSANSWEFVNHPNNCSGDECARYLNIEENKYLVCPRSPKYDALKTDRLDMLVAGRTACIFGAKTIEPVPKPTRSSDISDDTNLERCVIATCALAPKKRGE